MTQRSRNFLLTGPFSNGQRPDENDFNDVWDSFINFQDDPITLDGDDNLVISNGLQVGNSTGEAEGTIRFVGGVFQFRQSGSWVELGSGSGGGAFEEVGGGPNVAFNGGTVGINTGNTPTDYMMYVQLGNNSNNINTVGNRVRIGNAAIFTQSSGSPTRRAYFSHFNNANRDNFALRQENDGEVVLNAPNGQEISICHDGSVQQMIISDNGDVFIRGNIINAALTAILNSLDSRISGLGG